MVLIGCKTDLRKDKEQLRKLRAAQLEPITYTQVGQDLTAPNGHGPRSPQHCLPQPLPRKSGCQRKGLLKTTPTVAHNQGRELQTFDLCNWGASVAFLGAETSRSLRIILKTDGLWI